MPLPLDCELLHTKGWMCVMFSSCIPASNTTPGTWWELAPCCLMEGTVCRTFVPFSLAHHNHILFPDHPSPSWPSASLSLPFLLCPFIVQLLLPSPNDSSRGGTVPWVPSTISLSASQLLFFLKKWPSSWKPYCSKLRLLSYVFVRAQYSHLIEHSLGEVMLFSQLRTLFSDLLI